MHAETITLNVRSFRGFLKKPKINPREMKIKADKRFYTNFY